jgi:hypothetical protein
MSGQLFMGAYQTKPPTLIGGLPFLDLRQALHFVGQIVVPSVTQILKATGVSTDFDRVVREGKITPGSWRRSASSGARRTWRRTTTTRACCAPAPSTRG